MDQLTNLIWQQYLQAAAPGAARGMVHTIADPGEAAYRAGGPLSWDRRGDLIWWDRAEAHPATRWTLSGSGAEWAWSRRHAVSGSCCYAITTPATSSVAAAITLQLPAVQPAQGLGIEFAGAIDANLGHLDIFLNYYSGATKHTLGLSYSPGLQNLRYWQGASGAWYQAVALDYNLFTGPPGWHRFKLAVNPAARAYLYCVLDGAARDLSGLWGEGAVDAATRPGYEIVVRAFCADTSASVFWVDAVMVTTNEV